MTQCHSISRRRFLVAAAGTSLAAAGVSRAAGANDRLRLGLIGCGPRGLELLRAVEGVSASTRRAEIAAVCDAHAVRSERAGAFSNAKIYARWQDVVNRPDIDAIIVATPDHTHASISMAAMEAGKDVYCERPMALEIEEARAFHACAARTGRVVQIGAYEVAEKRWGVARKLVESGQIGKIVWCQADYAAQSAALAAPTDSVDANGVDWKAFLGDAPQRSFDADRYVNWRKYWDYSRGIAADTFYGKLAALLTAVGTGSPTRVSAAGGVYASDAREAPDSFVMSVEYSGGHTIVLASSPALRGLPATIRGRDGSIELYADSVRVVLEKTGQTLAYPAAGSKDLVADWLSCITTRERCVCDTALGCQATIAMAMAVEAYRCGRTLAFDETQGALVACVPHVSCPSKGLSA